MVTHYSYKSLLVASFLAVIPLAPILAAEAEDPYAVEKITVDADGKNTDDAKAKAQTMGEQEAFKQLITKLAPQKAAEVTARMTPSSISSMVKGVDVVEERMTADHYHGVLTYHFLPQPVQALTSTAPAPAPQAAVPAPAAATTTAAASADMQARSARKAVLVLPVYNDTRTTNKLWQDDNKWRNVWYESALESGGGLVVVPLGDMNDRVDVDNSNIGEATYQSLSRFYDRYGVGEIDILTAFYNLRADPKPALEVAIRRVSPNVSDVTRVSYIIRSTENLEMLMTRASSDIAKNIYKQQTIDRSKIEFQRQKEISARVNVSSIEDWVSLRKHLLAHGNIVGIRMTSVTNTQAAMVISYKGTQDMLQKTLVTSGLRVMIDGDSLVLALK